MSLLPAIPQVRFREIPKTGLPTILLSAAATPDFFTIWSAHKTILFWIILSPIFWICLWNFMKTVFPSTIQMILLTSQSIHRSWSITFLQHFMNRLLKSTQLKDWLLFNKMSFLLHLKFIQENYSTTLDIDTICSEISFSKHYFCKLFKKQMGITVHQYVNEYRISKSKELLSYSKLSINSIATQVGFRNTLTFLRAFEKSMHMTPSEYRNYY